MAPNRLISESSPYLLQHAHNPVDWYPWEAEAFAHARASNKPIFLSIGYSACHWCHVMEEESFESPEVADYLNRHFICIKVDREERPDIDHLYMSAVQAMTGSGGWPLSVFLTPEQKPFYGGTYFPPQDQAGRPGFLTLLRSVVGAWATKSKAVLETGEQMAALLRAHQSASGEPALVSEDLLTAGYQALRMGFDAKHGGFSHAPKFPTPHTLSFLMSYFYRSGEKQALHMVLKTLDAMAAGGICDHLGGGFHRYATDENWFLPHFEKMLYDQALLVKAYVEAYQLTNDKRYERIAREIIGYVLRELSAPQGGFFSAEDADSVMLGKDRKREGAFYVWSQAQIQEALGAEVSDLFCYAYGIEAHGNVFHDPFGEFSERNVLSLRHSLADLAAYAGKSDDEIVKILSGAKDTLLTIRNQWPRPQRDDKILTDWNGLWIASLALAGFVFGDVTLTRKAQEAYDAISLLHRDSQGRLLHCRRASAPVAGMLDDYAFWLLASLELYQATLNPSFLARAIELAEETLAFFWDSEGAGFFMTASDAERLLARPKEIYDGAVPSGNSSLARSFIRLFHLCGNPNFKQKAQLMLARFSKPLSTHPAAHTEMLQAIDAYLGPVREVVMTGKSEIDMAQMKAVYAKTYNCRSVLLARFCETAESLEKVSPFVKNCPIPESGAAVFICENQTCQLPISEVSVLEKFLKPLSQTPA